MNYKKQVTVLAQQLIKFQTTAKQKNEIKKCLAFVVNYLNKLGLKVRVYYSNNIPSLVAAREIKKHYQYILCGHLDVVPANSNEFIPRIKKVVFMAVAALI